MSEIPFGEFDAIAQLEGAIIPTVIIARLVRYFLQPSLSRVIAFGDKLRTSHYIQIPDFVKVIEDLFS
ncbi:hypothetical protein [Nostoc sp.]|uniref:hypothetical protein n=1 Tax=Nostoc sp. TaxID=1180 RepID=UPI002FF69A61